MRRGVERWAAQIIRDGAYFSSVCSTSGRLSAECTPQFAVKKGSRERFNFYDPSRDVYQEFQAKWDKANAEASAAAADLAGPPPRPPRAGFEPKGSAAAAAAAAAAVRPRVPPLVVPADADWPPGYGEMLLSYLQLHLPLEAEEAVVMVEAARRGLLPASRQLIRTRYMHLRDLEPRFPGFHAHSAVLSEPRLLRHSAAKLMRAMLVFQDLWQDRPVGALMAHIGRFVVADPIGAAQRMQALSRALRSELALLLDVRQLNPGSVFLSERVAPLELDARVAAVATIFGRDGGRRLLAADLDVLRFAPQELNSAVRALRAVFAARGYGKPQAHHVGTPEGAAEAAADRAYVTELVVAWPGALELTARRGEKGLAALVEGIRMAGGERYGGGDGWRALLDDVAVRPELLRAAAEAVGANEAGAGAEGAERLRKVVGAALQKLGLEKSGGAGGVEAAVA